MKTYYSIDSSSLLSLSSLSGITIFFFDVLRFFLFLILILFQKEMRVIFIIFIFYFKHRIDYYCCQTNTVCFCVLFLPWKSVLIFPLLDSDLVSDLWRFWSYYKLIHFFNNFPSLIKMDTYWLFWNLLGYPINCGSLVSDSPMFYQFYIQWSILYQFFCFYYK